MKDPLEVKILWTKLREKSLVPDCNTLAYRKGNCANHDRQAPQQ